jgi:AcrR family transcriptional regulator
MPRHRFANTRDRIEAAAIHLFVEKGVAETTVRDIARAVDISEGALYRHFDSKEQLVWQLFERHYLAFAQRLESLAGTEATARGKVAAMIRGFCHAHDENPELFRFLLFVQHGQLGRLAHATTTPVDVVRAIVDGGIASGELPGQDPELATSFVFGLVLQPVQFIAYGRLKGTMTSMSDRLARAAWSAIGGR